ncbi:hypothetical protein LPB86_15545 [Pedobacter sp. MC2016-14]|uniref:hypothetical protein n=1 Tax=Pedobacter sp. MC2016-14 TaxID=2897327 RepID=UPI001E335631|nr:hypothetical protein [Pedobacter sp. MC2016-14]MCD0489656.1 hypothetical protein [Pedobacter sp. MC2016-14]
MNTKFKNNTSPLGFRSHKSYSPEDVWAAGGTTAFGSKNGQSNENMAEIFKEFPEVEPFTEEEWNNTLKSLKESK